MRAAILGAGGAGLVHALALRAAGARVERIYDPDPARAAALADVVGGAAARSAEDVDDCDVVAICSPPAFHVEQAVRFAAEGRRVLLEKPIALEERGLTQLLGIRGCVPVLQWRFGRALRAVRAAIAEGELGIAPSVMIDLAWRRDDDYFAEGRRSLTLWGCGALLSIGIHAVDAALYALGDEVVARSVLARGRAGVDVETNAVASFRTHRGAQIALRLALDAAEDRTRISFCGGGVTADIEGTEVDPTAGAVRWSTRDEDHARRLRLLERQSSGYLGGPLVVPLVASALRGDRGVPSVSDVAPSHRALFAEPIGSEA